MSSICCGHEPSHDWYCASGGWEFAAFAAVFIGKHENLWWPEVMLSRSKPLSNGIGWVSVVDPRWTDFGYFQPWTQPSPSIALYPWCPTEGQIWTWQILEKWHSANSANDTGQLVTKPWSHEIWRYACARESPTAYRGFSSPLVVQTWCLCWTKILGITGLNMGVSDIGLPYMYGHVYRMGKTRL